MRSHSRRSLLALIGSGLPAWTIRADEVAQERPLPMSRIFRGEQKFHAMIDKALEEGWRERPIGKRVIAFARELHGTPYENFTLEIDDRVESPSVDLEGLDCWTFFEISLGLARMIASPRERYRPEDLLREIQFTRYRGGVCTGDYLERIHYLAEWFFENEARGVAEDITRELGESELIADRRISEMTTLWKHYRYLRENPELREPMGEWEDYVAALPVHHIPKSRIASIEPKLQDGDVIGIATRHHGGFCSHVGLAHRTGDGVMRFMHASRNYRRVVVDKSVSGYCNDFDSHAGIIVGRPLEVEHTVTDREIYRKNLERLTG